MTEQSHPRHCPAHHREQVLLGVDTHKDVHVAAVITSTGGLLDTRGFATTQEGYRQLLSWARVFGQLQRAGVECTGSYGAALTRHLHREGITVTEVNQPDKSGTAPARQVRLHRRGGRGPGRSLRPGHGHRQNGRRAGGNDSAVQAGQDLRRQVPLHGHQPAQGRARGRRPSAAGVPGRAE
ncbi:IS110 family transposase [Streptomyces sp. TLI_185]|uniref:IS110 family transposase n=1 Tax=Streptomyces sp. TLI_185 TaxID=2485151 RepID=UPI0021A4FA2F|nr:IS110 family transposase [Streptomyces sp. TLI_185]